MIVVAINKGGSYILAEMNGAVWQQKVAKFRVIPYFAREKIEIPDGIMAIIDADESELEKICAQPEEESDNGRDYLMDSVAMQDSDDSDIDSEVDEADDI